MPTPKQATSKTSRISIKRNGRVFAVIIEGGAAILMTGIVAAAYILHLFH